MRKGTGVSSSKRGRREGLCCGEKVERAWHDSGEGQRIFVYRAGEWRGGAADEVKGNGQGQGTRRHDREQRSMRGGNRGMVRCPTAWADCFFLLSSTS